jgi:hypothetical protein
MGVESNVYDKIMELGRNSYYNGREFIVNCKTLFKRDEMDKYLLCLGNGKKHVKYNPKVRHLYKNPDSEDLKYADTIAIYGARLDELKEDMFWFENFLDGK